MRVTLPLALFVALSLALPALLGGCRRAEPTATPPPGPTALAAGGGRGLAAPAPTPGVRFRLHDADPAGADAAARPPLAAGQPLPAARVATLLERLPALDAAEAVTATFALRPGPEPPRLTGETIREPFPPAATASGAPDAPAPDAGALEVERYRPQGEVTVAPHLAVTFSQPMVPVTSHGELQAAAVPVSLSPLPAGSWRWAGTRTLLFEPDSRFPMATEYTVEVPAGLRGPTGTALAETLTWRFGTPPPELHTFHPGDGPVERQPLLFAQFDQAVRQEDVLAHAALSAGRGRGVALRAATADEIEADERVRALAEEAPAGRWVVMRPIEPLPLGVTATVTFQAGMPSAEGPRVTGGEQAYAFKVHGPLALRRLSCNGVRPVDGNRIRDCRPLGAFVLELTNPLDAGSIDPGSVEVTPALEGRRVEIHGDTVRISGAANGRTTYLVRLPGALRDTFGTSLGADTEASFVTGDAAPALVAPGQSLVVLDPAGPRALELLSVNNSRLDVSLHRVAPADWADFIRFADRLGARAEDRLPPPGEQVWSGGVEPGGPRDAPIAVPVDLTPALTDGLGQVVVVAQPAGWAPDDDRWANRPVARWVQATGLGLTVLSDGQDVTVWAAGLADGRPLAGVDLSLTPGGGSGSTGATGLAALAPLPAALAETWPSPAVLVARLGADLAFLPASYGGAWTALDAPAGLAWYVFEDRGLYRPGEAAHVKGWLRRAGGGRDGDLAALGVSAARVAYTLTAANGTEVATGSAVVDDLGGFHLTLALPRDMELGSASLRLAAEGPGLPPGEREHLHQLLVNEFRRPEFEVAVSAERDTHVAGEAAVVAARASYFAGGALPGAPVRWWVEGRPTVFDPPGHDGFQFGTVRPWPWDPEFGIGTGWAPAAAEVGWWPEQSAGESHEAVTDGTGAHRLAIELTGVEPVAPVAFRAEATVEDLNRQAWAGSAALVVHPADRYVGLRAERGFARAGGPFQLSAVVVDLDGTAVPGVAVALRSARVERVMEGGRMVEKLEPAAECALTSGPEPVSCTLEWQKGGAYRLTADITDGAGRPNRTEITLHVAGEGAREDRSLRAEEVTLVADAATYRPGDTAEILVVAPFSPAEGLLTVDRAGAVRVQRFRLDDGTAVVVVPIESRYAPNVHVRVDVVGVADRDQRDGSGSAPAVDPDTGAASGEPRAGGAPPRPAFASAALELTVLPVERELAVTARPLAAAVAPGASTTVEVTVRDAADVAVAGAGVALVVVDEAVLALTAHAYPDPIDVLYPHRWPAVSVADMRGFVQLAAPDAMAAAQDELLEAVPQAMTIDRSAAGSLMAESMPAEAEMMAGEEPPGFERRMALDREQAPVAVRSALDPLAAFVPDLRTGTDGSVTAGIDLPDNVTRYRVLAVATDGDVRFGKGEAALVARLPLVVRPSLPRFLNFGDSLELPVVVQNNGTEALEAEVVVRAANLRLPESRGTRVTVPAGDRVEVRFAAAADLPGTAVVQVAAFSAGAADAQQVSLPVWTPATTEAFAAYGEIDAGAVVQPVRAPADAVPQFGGLELQTSSTALAELTDAYLYLRDSPFDGTEQMASRLAATVALADLLAAFDAAEAPSAADVDASVRRDVERLAGLQSHDGGWGWWPGAARSEPFVTVHVTHALARARDKGRVVPDQTMDRATAYLRDIASYLDDGPDEATRRSIRAYALFVRALSGDLDARAGRELLAEADAHAVETLGWLLYVLGDDPASGQVTAGILRDLGNRVSEEAATAQFTEAYEEHGGHLILASDRRSDAVVLEALVVRRPESGLVPRLARGLLAHRVNGRWASTQENAFVLLALDRYFRAYEAVAPNYVARAWLDDGFVSERAFRGRSPDRALVELPLALLPEGRDADLVLAKEGPGRLYYRLGLRYAPRELELEPLARGFEVTRAYEALDAPDDVRRAADGTWQVRAGARVRVELTMVAPARRYHVALVDPLPAGFEALNPELATTGTVPPAPDDDEPGGRSGRGGWWWPWTWHDHTAFRDERAEAFASLLEPGVHVYRYVARATTPGEFVVPPARAEELYHPETFGRSGTERVVVVGR